MINTDDFTKRLEFVMDHFGLSASSFADKISVQRSSISHLLSGRNKPSLDFIMKIIDVFPELNLYWILEGTGCYLKNETDEITLKKTENTPTLVSKKETKEAIESLKNDTLNDLQKENLIIKSDLVSQSKSEKILEKIVFIYSDGTFREYNPFT